MKQVVLKNKNNEKVLPDFITDDLSSNSHFKVPSVYGVKELLSEEFKEGENLISSSSNITVSNIYYKKYGKMISLRLTFHVISDISNGTTFATLNINPPITGFFQIIRSASSEIIGGVNIEGYDKVELLASGTIKTADWYTLAITYITI